jgi:Kef-type K+ transport system membrane component KefB
LHFTTLSLLLAQIAAILLASRLLGLLTRALGQPMVIAEMIAGILLGPSLLGALWPAAYGALFPRDSLPVLHMLSQLGLVLFMFLIGLELDPDLLRGRRRASVTISHTSIALPFVLGVGSAWLVSDSYKAPSVEFLPFALFLGTALSVTAFPVLARILSERGLMQSRVGAIAIACAAVDDVTAWCLLATVVALAQAGDVSGALPTLCASLAFALFTVFVVRPLLKRWVDASSSPSQPGPGVVVALLFMLLLSAASTEVIGIHALFGAFLFGACVPKQRGLARAIGEKFEATAVFLLMPLFFAYSGLRTHVGLVGSALDWAVTLGFIVVATVGKFGGSALAARATGLRWREAGAIGVLMNTRGLMELIVLNVGMDLGVITPTVFTMLVIMAVVTTVATSPLLGWIYPESEQQREVAEPQASAA